MVLREINNAVSVLALELFLTGSWLGVPKYCVRTIGIQIRHQPQQRRDSRISFLNLLSFMVFFRGSLAPFFLFVVALLLAEAQQRLAEFLQHLIVNCYLFIYC